MEIFINEMSINEQFINEFEFNQGIERFIELLITIDKLNLDTKYLFINEIYFSLNLLKGTRFDSSLKSDKSLNTRFILNYDRLRPTSWLKNQIHSGQNTYEYLGVDCINTSIAEITERKYNSTSYTGFMLNFIKSNFGESSNFDVDRNKVPINIPCCSTSSGLYNCLTSIGYIHPNQRTFEHHRQKHDRKRPTHGNSILLCSDGKAQELLNTACFVDSPFDNRLYNYDTEHNKIIVFNKHTALSYHGYHIDGIDNIPNKILKQLNIKA